MILDEFFEWTKKVVKMTKLRLGEWIPESTYKKQQIRKRRDRINVIFNYSRIVLSKEMEKVLNRGLKFCIQPLKLDLSAPFRTMCVLCISRLQWSLLQSQQFQDWVVSLMFFHLYGSSVKAARQEKWCVFYTRISREMQIHQVFPRTSLAEFSFHAKMTNSPTRAPHVV